MLNELIGSRTRAELLKLFFLLTESDGRFYLRQIARVIKKNPNAVRLELNRLERISVLKSERVANLRYYSLNKKNPLVEGLREVVILEDSLEKKDKALKEFVRKSTTEYKDDIDEITVFGSYARGNIKPESDIDVLVTVKNDRFGMLKKLVNISYDIMLKYREYVSVKTVTHDERLQMEKTASSFAKSILIDGRVLYG